MDYKKKKEILDSLIVLVDTREQNTALARKRWKSLGYDYHKAKLNYGDYAYNFRVNGEWFYDESKPVDPDVCVERKMSADELALCFTRERARFEREMVRAKESGATIYLLIENATYESIFKHEYRSKFTEKAFIASLMTWQARYNLHVIMCKNGTSGRLIAEILFRELIERLERGDYDATR